MPGHEIELRKGFLVFHNDSLVKLSSFAMLHSRRDSL